MTVVGLSTVRLQTFLTRFTSRQIALKRYSSTMANWQEAKQRYLDMNLDQKRANYKCGKNFVTLDKVIPWSEYAKIKNLSSAEVKYPPNAEFNERISIFTGDITCLEIDAIVNAAN